MSSAHQVLLSGATLSVVIPSYNCGALLPRAVRSTCDLGVPELEIIVVDDGSTDDTPDRLAALTLEYPHLISIRQPNAGLSAARNAGIARATGTYVLLLDADDELIECDLSPMLGTGVDMIRIGVEEVEIDGTRRMWLEDRPTSTGRDYIRASFEVRAFFPASWSYLYRRAWLQGTQLRFVPGLLHEDELFTVQALLAAPSFAAAGVPVYRYIRRPGSITLAQGDDRLRARINSLLFIAQELVRMANADPAVDLRWRIRVMIDSARALAGQSISSWTRWRLVGRVSWLLAKYRGCGRHGFTYLERRCLGRTLRAAWDGRDLG